MSRVNECSSHLTRQPCYIDKSSSRQLTDQSRCTFALIRATNENSVSRCLGEKKESLLSYYKSRKVETNSPISRNQVPMSETTTRFLNWKHCPIIFLRYHTMLVAGSLQLE